MKSKEAANDKSHKSIKTNTTSRVQKMSFSYTGMQKQKKCDIIFLTKKSLQTVMPLVGSDSELL